LEIKWKSILSLQKKITTLEEKCQGLEDELAKGGGGGLAKNININELYLPKTPAKYAMTGHKATVTSIAFHPQFTQLATSS
jgi:platelet-activating factor acetylhydrolase IB subunit alpha